MGVARVILMLGVAGVAALPHPAPVAGQASMLTPYGADQASLSGCDDCNVEVPLTTVFSAGVNFGGTVYTSLYIGTNGYITFGHGNSSYSPLGIAGYSQGPIVAAQFDDLDPRKGGTVWYAENDPGGYLVATFEDVLPYTDPAIGSAGSQNTFQIVLRRVAPGSTDFQIELRYNKLEWVAGNSGWPTAGWSAGDQATYAELPESGQAIFQDVLTDSNVSEAGVFRWDVVGGIVQSTPTAVTGSASSVTGSGAVIAGNVTSDGGFPVTARGVVYSTTAGPTLADATAASGSGAGAFSATLTGLSTNTTYYARAYATNVLGTGYGHDQAFTTLNVSPQTLTFPALPDVVYGVADFDAGASASSALPVSYASNNTAVATVSGSTVRIVGSGTVTLTATQAGNASFSAAAPVARTFDVTARPIQGAFTVPASKPYDATTAATVLTRTLVGVESGDVGQVALIGGTATYDDASLATAKTVTLTGASLTGARAIHYTLSSVQTTTADIVPGPLDHVTIDGPASTVAGEKSGFFMVTLRDAFGNPTPATHTTVFRLAVDGQAAWTAVFEPEALAVQTGAATAVFRYSNSWAGNEVHTLKLRHASGDPIATAPPPQTIWVTAGEIDHFRITGPNEQALGTQRKEEAFNLQLAAVDAHGNPVPGFTQTVMVSSDGPLAGGAGATAAFRYGILDLHQVLFSAAGTFLIRVETTVAGKPVSGSLEISIEDPAPDLVLTLTGDESPAPGQLVTFRLVVRNEGEGTARDLVITNPLAGQARLVIQDIAVDAGSVDALDHTWSLAALQAGGQATMVIQAMVVFP